MTEGNGSLSNDRMHQAQLAELDWNVIIVWACELKDMETARVQLLAELSRAVTQLIQYPTTEESEVLKAAEKEANYSA